MVETEVSSAAPALHLGTEVSELMNYLSLRYWFESLLILWGGEDFLLPQIKNLAVEICVGFGDFVISMWVFVCVCARACTCSFEKHSVFGSNSSIWINMIWSKWISVCFWYFAHFILKIEDTYNLFNKVTRKFSKAHSSERNKIQISSYFMRKKSVTFTSSVERKKECLQYKSWY